MLVTRTSEISNITRTQELNITSKEIKSYVDGKLIQLAFPNLNVHELEFIKTGITIKEWDDLFGEEE
jgi:hypothetical protein